MAVGVWVFFVVAEISHGAGAAPSQNVLGTVEAPFFQFCVVGGIMNGEQDVRSSVVNAVEDSDCLATVFEKNFIVGIKNPGHAVAYCAAHEVRPA